MKNGPVHIGQWGTFVMTPEVIRRRGDRFAQITIDNDGMDDADVTGVVRGATHLT